MEERMDKRQKFPTAFVFCGVTVFGLCGLIAEEVISSLQAQRFTCK
jgi:hypothetical protein